MSGQWVANGCILWHANYVIKGPASEQCSKGVYKYYIYIYYIYNIYIYIFRYNDLHTALLYRSEALQEITIPGNKLNLFLCLSVCICVYVRRSQSNKAPSYIINVWVK